MTLDRSQEVERARKLVEQYDAEQRRLIDDDWVVSFTNPRAILLKDSGPDAIVIVTCVSKELAKHIVDVHNSRPPATIEEALARCKKWELTDEEAEELMK